MLKTSNIVVLLPVLLFLCLFFCIGGSMKDDSFSNLYVEPHNFLLGSGFIASFLIAVSTLFLSRMLSEKPTAGTQILVAILLFASTLPGFMFASPSEFNTHLIAWLVPPLLIVTAVALIKTRRITGFTLIILFFFLLPGFTFVRSHYKYRQLDQPVWTGEIEGNIRAFWIEEDGKPWLVVQGRSYYQDDFQKIVKIRLDQLPETNPSSDLFKLNSDLYALIIPESDNPAEYDLYFFEDGYIADANYGGDYYYHRVFDINHISPDEFSLQLLALSHLFEYNAQEYYSNWEYLIPMTERIMEEKISPGALPKEEAFMNTTWEFDPYSPWITESGYFIDDEYSESLEIYCTDLYEAYQDKAVQEVKSGENEYYGLKQVHLTMTYPLEMMDEDFSVEKRLHAYLIREELSGYLPISEQTLITFSEAYGETDGLTQIEVSIY